MNKILAALVFVAVAACVSAQTRNVIEVYHKGVYNVGVLRNRKPVVVYYYNAKCKRQTCEWIGPQLERMARRKSEQLYLATVDTDRIPSFVEEHGIQRYPTVMTVKDGEIVDVVEGSNWDQIVKLVNRAAKL